MNLNKMFVFLFVFLGFSAILLQHMPGEFLSMGVEASYQDKEVKDFFDARDILTYNNTYAVNLTYPCAEKSEWGLPEDERLEFWWAYCTHFTCDMFQLRHLKLHWTGWWWDWHYLTIPSLWWKKTPLKTGLGLDKSGLLALFNEEYNASYCEWSCDHIDVRLFIVTANQSWTLEESWDNGELKVFSSYNVNIEKTGMNMWFIMAQLLLFQNPDLGIPGVGGTILSHGVGLSLWGSIALLVFAFITSVVPFIRGWVGGGG